MSYEKKIEIYKILDSNFVTPLAKKPNDDKASYIDGDLIIIFDEQVWVKNRDNQDDDEYSLAVYPPAFVRVNTKLFEKIR